MLTLEAARVNNKLTQAQAAIKLGVSTYTVANWESHKTYPNALDLLRIEQVYGVRFDELIFLPRNDA
ncbi:MAG: helix-turn-helix domain-containing protein [Oscillospiraceae bacterium]|nr:helix-turn-helix domain-containing protein [Oscillospiraceae bacterium]